MKNMKKLLLTFAVTLSLSFSLNSFATGAKVKPPASSALVEVVWFQPILDLFDF